MRAGQGSSGTCVQAGQQRHVCSSRAAAARVSAGHNAVGPYPLQYTRSSACTQSAQPTKPVQSITRVQSHTVRLDHADEPANRSHTRNLRDASGTLVSCRTHSYAASLRRTEPAVHAPMLSYGSVPAETKQHAVWLCSALPQHSVHRIAASMFTVYTTQLVRRVSCIPAW